MEVCFWVACLFHVDWYTMRNASLGTSTSMHLNPTRNLQESSTSSIDFSGIHACLCLVWLCLPYNQSNSTLSFLWHTLSYCVRLENLPSLFCSLQLQVLCMKSLQILNELLDGIGYMTSLSMFEVWHKKQRTYWWCCCSFHFEALQLLVRTVEHSVHDVLEVDYGPHSSLVSIGKLSCQHLEINHLEKVEQPLDAETSGCKAFRGIMQIPRSIR